VPRPRFEPNTYEYTSTALPLVKSVRYPTPFRIILFTRDAFRDDIIMTDYIALNVMMIRKWLFGNKGREGGHDII
jgi:hypothetical protein